MSTASRITLRIAHSVFQRRLAFSSSRTRSSNGWSVDSIFEAPKVRAHDSSRKQQCGGATNLGPLSPYGARRKQNASRDTLTHTPCATNSHFRPNRESKNPVFLRVGNRIRRAG